MRPRFEALEAFFPDVDSGTELDRLETEAIAEFHGRIERHERGGVIVKDVEINERKRVAARLREIGFELSA